MKLICTFLLILMQTLLFSQKTDTILFPKVYANDSSINCSKWLNEVIGQASQSLVISFAEGNYYFESTVKLKSNISIVGNPDLTTKLIFDQKGKGDLIEIKGNVTKEKIKIEKEINKDQFEVFIAGTEKFKVGMMVRLFKSKPAIPISDWAKTSIGQVMKVSHITDTSMKFASSVRLNYSLVESPLLEIINPIEKVTLSNLIIERRDKTNYQTSNISIVYARDCKLLNITSIMTNFAHLNIDYSLNIQVEKFDAYNSFSHGNGGNGYGIALQYSSSDCLIQDCVFRKLRHGIVIQSGANGNVVTANYALEGFWEDVKLPKSSSGDIVLHGNFPYVNSIIGNVCNQIVVDKSHGLNGYNLILKNRLLKYGIFVQRQSIDSVAIQQNDLIKSKCFQGKIRGRRKDMILIANRRNSKDYRTKAVDNLICKSFKDGERVLYSIGYPCDFNNFYNAAYFRYNSSLISTFN